MTTLEQDPAFARLVAEWRGDRLGPEKNEGIGILWKEGGIVELLVALHEAAPRTMAALADRLLALDSGDGLMRGFLDAWSRPTPAERTAALDDLDLYPPLASFAEALARLEPPMPRRFRERIEAWLDLARAIEARTGCPPPAARRPIAVSHPKFGMGEVLDDLGDRARVRFEDGSEKTLLWSYLAMRP